MAVLLLMLAGAACADSARDAVKAFAKLQARTEAGVTYRDYSEALGNVNYEFKAFKDSQEWAKYPAVASALSNALGRYAEAATIWDFGITTNSPTLHEQSVIRQIAAKYPAAGKPMSAGGAAFDTGGMHITSVLPYFWQDAAASVETARRSLPK
jgi:hypothetical protein